MHLISLVSWLRRLCSTPPELILVILSLSVSKKSPVRVRSLLVRHSVRLVGIVVSNSVELIIEQVIA